MALASSEIARLLEIIPLNTVGIARELGRSPATIYRWRKGKTVPSVGEIETLRRIAWQSSTRRDGRPDFRFVDLFAGIGGMRLGVEAIGGRCVFSCERDKFSRLTYQENFKDAPDHPFAEDIKAVAPIDIPAHDLLLAGFPC